MLFEKNDAANFVSKGQNIEKVIPENKKSTKCCIYSKLKARIYLLFSCVKHVRGQFKTDLKLRNIGFKQLAKAFPAVWKIRAILFKTILFGIL
jgi:hypothetical protein